MREKNKMDRTLDLSRRPLVRDSQASQMLSISSLIYMFGYKMINLTNLILTVRLKMGYLQ
jgi:hypothetical protein